MTYYIEVDESIELPIVWNDDRVAQYITFCTAESEFEECEVIDGVSYATYETLQVGPEGYEITIIEPDGAICLHVIPEGEYGIHETHISLRSSELPVK